MVDADAFKQLTRIVKPFSAEVVLAALDGAATPFDVDDTWHAHSHGRPRPASVQHFTWGMAYPCFDASALLAGGQAIAYLAAQLPVGHPRRDALPALYAKIQARLAHPGLLLFAGYVERLDGRTIEGEPYVPPGKEAYEHLHGVDNGAVVVAAGYVYFRPASLRRPEDVALVEASFRETESSDYPPWRALTSEPFARLVARVADTPLAAGAFEIDPRASVPELVAEVCRTHAPDLDEDAATLYLQLLTLPDAGDKLLRAVNGWTPKRHKRAGEALVAAKLARAPAKKKPRADRALALPGPWEKLAPPSPAMERWKLELYQARLVGRELLAPLDRLLLLAPAHERFAAAWRRVCAGEPPGRKVALDRQQDDLLAPILADPDDDQRRLVYADRLSEQGDPRGELITLQVQRAMLSRSSEHDKAEPAAAEPAAAEPGAARPAPAEPTAAEPDAAREQLAAIIAREEALLAEYGEAWTAKVNNAIRGYRMERGFIHSVTVRIPEFAAHAAEVLSALPLLREIVLQHGAGPGPLPLKHLELLAGCEALAGIHGLDLTPDHYLRDLESLERLLAAPCLRSLRWLRLGFHRTCEGFGREGAERIASCAQLGQLRSLEVAGQSLGAAGAEALLASTSLNKLERLRLPLNNIRVGGAKRLLRALEAGALPALRVLDLDNTVATDFVTKAALWERNRVPDEQQAAIAALLTARGGVEGSLDPRSGEARDL
jgi:uncharacterized protein (TIGR02996 family)